MSSGPTLSLLFITMITDYLSDDFLRLRASRGSALSLPASHIERPNLAAVGGSLPYVRILHPVLVDDVPIDVDT